MFAKRAQRPHLAHKPPGLAEALGKLCVPGRERLPDHIFQWMHLGHRSQIGLRELSQDTLNLLRRPRYPNLAGKQYGREPTAPWNRAYSFRSTCSTSTMGCPRKRWPSRRNFSTESVAKNRSRGLRSSPPTGAGSSPGNCEATARAVDSAESTILTCSGAARRRRGFSRG